MYFAGYHVKKHDFLGKEFCRISVKRKLFCHVRIRKEKTETIIAPRYVCFKAVHYLLKHYDLNKPSMYIAFHCKKEFHFVQN